MRKISRIYEPFAGAVNGGLSAQGSSRYVCRTCLRRRTATQLPSSSSHFSTSAQRAGVLDSFKSVGDRLTGKKSMSDDAQKEVKESKDDSYTPADTWDGLEWVGTKQWHESMKRPQQAFEGFGPIATPKREPAEIREHLLAAVTDTLADRLPERQSLGIEDGEWTSISLEDLDIRFAVAKEVQLRTGLRLTDPELIHAKTVGAMFALLKRPEKPKKLAEGLLKHQMLSELPNVQIKDRRVTWKDREREVGRWKQIEDVAEERGIVLEDAPDPARQAQRA